MLKEDGIRLPAGARFFFVLGRDEAGGSVVPLTAVLAAELAASVCLETIETALRNSGELIDIPGTNEKGSRRTGMEEARASVKRNMSFKQYFEMGNETYHGQCP